MSDASTPGRVAGLRRAVRVETRVKRVDHGRVAYFVCAIPALLLRGSADPGPRELRGAPHNQQIKVGFCRYYLVSGSCLNCGTVQPKQCVYFQGWKNLKSTVCTGCSKKGGLHFLLKVIAILSFVYTVK